MRNLFEKENSVDRSPVADSNAVGATQPLRAGAGFTIVELLVTIAVIAIMTTIFITGRSSYSQTVNLGNVTHNISLMVQQAQSYGVTSRGSEVDASIDTSDLANQSNYGVQLSTSNPNTVNLFEDRNGNEGLDGGEVVDAYTIPEDMRVAKLCLGGSVGGCDSGGGGVSQLEIIFRRPNPDAFFYGNGGANPGASIAVIIIEGTESENNARRAIVVNKTGFVAVENFYDDE